jgi:hypothetical protein
MSDANSDYPIVKFLRSMITDPVDLEKASYTMGILMGMQFRRKNLKYIPHPETFQAELEKLLKETSNTDAIDALITYLKFLRHEILTEPEASGDE